MSIARDEAGTLDSSIMAPSPVFAHGKVERETILLTIEIAIAIGLACEEESIGVEFFFEWQDELLHE